MVIFANDTGYSGKSSLVLTIFRLLELTSGVTLIDNIDIPKLPLNLIRSKIIAIPQESFILNDSVRYNIDPAGQISDEEMIKALETTDLWGYTSAHSGLNSTFETISLSHGQRQLFALARAILRNCKIVVLDEAMSSVDHESGRLMQSIIDKEFQDCTVITITHRKDQISAFDKAVVMEQGCVKYYGSLDKLFHLYLRFIFRPGVSEISALPTIYKGGKSTQKCE